MKIFSILDYRYDTPSAIAEKVNFLRQQPMKENSHGYCRYKGWPIGKAAEAQAQETLRQNRNKNPTISLIDVVLSANRSYEKHVRPHVENLRKTRPDLTLKELEGLLDQYDFRQFKGVWGHADEKKYILLKRLVQVLLKKYPASYSDYDRLDCWAKASDYRNRKNDPIGGIPNVGPATYQHLRMTFGVDTVKPDQRVKEVLDHEFGARLNDDRAILAVEEIARLTGLRVIEVDQIFVKYGSGYYAKNQLRTSCPCWSAETRR